MTDEELNEQAERMLEERRAAVEKIKAFEVSLNETCELFLEAAKAVRRADDFDSHQDAEIADAIQKHLETIGQLCEYGNELGVAVGQRNTFGSKRTIIEI